MNTTLPEQKWEDVPHNRGTYLSRLKVPGGWLIREEQDVQTYHPGPERFATGSEWRSSICFMPDPLYQWLQPIAPTKEDDSVEAQIARMNA